MVTAIAALALSIVNWAQLNRRASMTLTTPALVRIAQGTDRQGTERAYVHLQPTFTVAERTDVTSVISWVRLEVEPAPGSSFPVPQFFWDETGQFTYDSEKGVTNYQFVSDPGPIVVTQDRPQIPNILFNSDRPFAASRWTWRIVAERQNQAPLVKEICVDITAANVDLLTKAGLGTYYEFRNIRPSSSQDPSCYAL